MVKRAYLGKANISSSRRTYSVDQEQTQRAAFLNELALAPPPSIVKRARCGVGKHGLTARKFKKIYLLDDGSTMEIQAWATHFFCVSCGKEWEEGGV